jgi:hypothetical protein
MAKVKVTGLKGLRSNIRKQITTGLRQKEIRDDIGQIVSKDIKEKSQGAPASSTLEWRKRYDPINKTDPKYNRNQIKFVFTGELLADLASNVRLALKSGLVSYIVENSKKLHKKYNGVTKKIGSRSPYNKIAEGLRDLGYAYPNISKKSQKSILKMIKLRLNRFLKRSRN